MKKLSDYPLCFSVNPNEVTKYGGHLNMKDSFNILAIMRAKKRIQKIKRGY